MDLETPLPEAAPQQGHNRLQVLLNDVKILGGQSAAGVMSLLKLGMAMIDAASEGILLANNAGSFSQRVIPIRYGITDISLRYVGVSADSRRRGIFAALVEKMKADGVPLTASVLHGNRSAMADRLVKSGFSKAGSDAKEAKLRWERSGSEGTKSQK
jgi:hypothetical protein